MKTTYTNKQLQEAIDAAFRESSGDDGFWLGIARAFLDNLPEQTEQEVLSLSQLRPLSKAGPVPEGCVRVTGYCENGSWFLGVDCLMTQDTHFADIRLPSTEKPDPLVTKSDSSPEWTPQVGDVVRLKSGGPLMTVGCPIEHTIPSVSCAWFDGTTLCSTPIPTACLELSTKEDAR